MKFCHVYRQASLKRDKNPLRMKKRINPVKK